MRQLVFIARTLRKNAKLNAINIFSMALGIVAAGIILGYVYQEFHYDCGNQNSKKIYRVIQEQEEGSNPYTYGPLAHTLKFEFPEVKEAVRVSFFYGYLACAADKNKFNEALAIFADSGFFDLFSFPLVKGNSKECLLEPNAVVLSETAVHKYFGDDDPIGKMLKIGSDQEFTVTGIYRNFKANSNFKGDLVLPLKKISRLTQIWIEPSWEYTSEIHTFVLLADKTSIQELSGKARKIISKYIPETKTELKFQLIKDIHIDKQTLWESAPKTNVTYLYILVIIAFIILGISGANFLFLFAKYMTKI